MATTPKSEQTAPEPTSSPKSGKGEVAEMQNAIAGKELPSDARADGAAGETQKAIQEKFDQEAQRGYRGVAVDLTPNDHYTLAGVTDPAKHVPEEFKTQTGKVVFPETPKGAQGTQG